MKTTASYSSIVASTPLPTAPPAALHTSIDPFSPSLSSYSSSTSSSSSSTPSVTNTATSSAAETSPSFSYHDDASSSHPSFPSIISSTNAHQFSSLSASSSASSFSSSSFTDNTTIFSIDLAPPPSPMESFENDSSYFFANNNYNNVTFFSNASSFPASPHRIYYCESRMDPEVAVPIYGYIAPVLILFTCLLNCFIFVILMKKSMRSQTHSILTAIAVSDTLTGQLVRVVFMFIGRSEGALCWLSCRYLIAIGVLLPKLRVPSFSNAYRIPDGPISSSGF